MVLPMLGSIFGERKILQAVAGDGFIEMQQDAQTGLRNKRMSGCVGDMVTGNSACCFREARRCQEFFDRKMRELYDI